MHTRNKVLVVDDEVGWCEVCEASLKKEGVAVVGARTVAEGAKRLKEESFDICLLDLKLPDGSGLDLIPIGTELDPDLCAIIITAFPTLNTAIEATRRGAYDYLVKPFSPDQLRLVVSRALERRRLQNENQLLARRVQGAGPSQMIGESQAMLAVFRKIEQVAPTHSEVLITGESGTGKELVARAIHRASPRGGRPFVPVDCGTLPENLVESELFGYNKGAFTGATRKQIGLFDYAAGGTLFFDEISELAPASQVKLLRVVQEREFRRVGGRETIEADVRLLAASNRELDTLVKEGTFREDLYYRLNVFEIRLPPLRDRRGDIPLLIAHLLDRVARELGGEPVEITAEAAEVLAQFDWPGNVRQLKNTLKSASILCGRGPIGPEHLPPALRGGTAPFQAPEEGELGNFHEARDRAMEHFERAYLCELLERHQGSVVNACKEASLSRSSFYYLLQRHGVQPATFRTSARSD